MGYTTKFSGFFTLDRKEAEALRRPLAPAENQIGIERVFPPLAPAPVFWYDSPHTQPHGEIRHPATLNNN